jgi:cell division protein FtsB
MKTVLVILLCVLVLLQVRLWTGPGSVADIARLQSAIVEQTDANAGLQSRNSVLMEEVSDLRNGLDSIEERARNELGMIREGETFYLIVDEAPKERQSGRRATEPASSTSAPEELASEPVPEIVEDDNPYLEMFRDEEEGAPEQARAANAQAPAAGLTAGQ